MYGQVSAYLPASRLSGDTLDRKCIGAFVVTMFAAAFAVQG
jgi:hypothetical protein